MIKDLVMLFSAGKGDWRFQIIGSECDETPNSERSWNKKELLKWLSDNNYVFLDNYKYGKIYIKEETPPPAPPL